VAWLRRPSGAALRALFLAALLIAVAGCGGGSRPSGPRAAVYATGLPTVSAFALDARGRLWATTSAASDHRKDGVYLIPPAGARPVKVIGGVHGPLGLTWYRGTLYVASLGRVEAFSGLHGTRFAHRETILREPSGHGWNNGIVALPNGRLAMGISSACDHCKPTSKWSASIVTFRPDGSDVRLFAKHIRAPYGLARYPGSSDLLVSMNQRDDLGARTPGDWLARVGAGQDWSFPECYGQPGTACAGVPAPIAVLDKHAAAGGVAVSGRTAFVAEWQAGRVLAVSLTGTRATATPLLTGIRNPLAMATTPDGALFVGDWGTGKIYRVASAGK